MKKGFLTKTIIMIILAIFMILVKLNHFYEIPINIIANNPHISLNYYREKFANDEIIATLEIPDVFNILITQSKDNDYYLNHSITKEKDNKGTEFMDYRTSTSSQQINIYGHNSKTYNLPFRKLENYKNIDFYNENSEIILSDDNTIYYYQIFSFKETLKDYEHMIVDTTGKSFINHLEKLISNSIYHTKVEITDTSHILVLQTCSYENKDSYYILCAILTKQESL